MSKPTTKKSKPEAHPVSEKPPKPYEGFPLFPHGSGRWAKKINGKLHYFGKWGKRTAAGVVWADDVNATATAALEKLNHDLPHLKAGRTPPPMGADYLSVGKLCNLFLAAKKRLVESGEIAPRSYMNYVEACGLLVDRFGGSRRADDLRPDDWGDLRAAMSAKGWGPVTLGRMVKYVRVAMKWASDERLLDRPAYYGQSFNRPTGATLRKAKAVHGPKLYSADELRRILDALSGETVEGADGKPITLKPDPALRAAVLLGVNCGLGNNDLSELQIGNVAGEWLDFPRPKTGIARRCPLWGETVEAIAEAIAARPKPRSKADAGCVFLTPRGGKRLVRVYERKAGGFARVDELQPRFRAMLAKLGINHQRSFYDLRRTHRTVADGAKDPVACDILMGHSDGTQGGVYRQSIENSRLRDVAEHIRGWLFPSEAAAE